MNIKFIYSPFIGVPGMTLQTSEGVQKMCVAWSCPTECLQMHIAKTVRDVVKALP